LAPKDQAAPHPAGLCATTGLVSRRIRRRSEPSFADSAALKCAGRQRLYLLGCEPTQHAHRGEESLGEASR
jgi:hypothetical protein